MIEVSHVSKSFGGQEVVQDLSFKAESGGIVGFLGPNGSGKSTTLKMIATLLSPDRGTVSVCGFDTKKNARKVREQIGYLPEHLPLYPELTVEEFLSFFARIRGVPARAVRAQVSSLLHVCHLDDAAKKLCGHLSKGFRQRLGIAQALVHDPKVLLLDEPTNGLDPEQAQEFRKLLISVAQEKTVLVSSHLLHEMSTLCSKIVMIRAGKLVCEKEVLEHTRVEELENLFVSGGQL